MNVSAKFQFILPVDSEELIFKYFFRNLAFWLPWQPIKLRALDKKYVLERTIQEIFPKNFCKISAMSKQ